MINNNNNRSLLLILLLIWLAGCIAQYLFCCKTEPTRVTTSPNTTKSIPLATSKSQPVLPGLTIDGLFGKDFSAPDNITFTAQQKQPNPMPTSVNAVIDNLAVFLSENPKKSLEITGYYLSNNSETADKNLGLERAQNLKKLLVTKGFQPQDITLSSKAVQQLQGSSDTHKIASHFAIVDSPELSEQPKELAPLSPPFSVQLGDKLLVSKDNFNFIRNDASPMPLSNELKDNVSHMISYLKDSASRQLTITGIYHPDEENSSIFPNLGLARANQIKNQLTELGANSEQILTSSKSDATLIANKDNEYLGLATFIVKTVDDKKLADRKQQMRALATSIKAKPLTIYFDTGNAEINLTDAQRSSLINIINYLDYDTTAKASITGHTDNVGNREKNIELGKERAQFAAEHLVKKGLNQTQVQITSKGPDLPIASNDDAEGRAKNRRVVISLISTQ